MYTDLLIVTLIYTSNLVRPAQCPISVCQGFFHPHVGCEPQYLSRSTLLALRSTCTELWRISMPATWLPAPQRSLGSTGTKCLPPLRSKVQTISKAQQA